MALDESKSMVVKDSSWLKDYKAGEQELLNVLSDKYELTTYSFAQTVRTENRFQFSESSTDIEGLLDKVAAESDFQQLKGCILISDGIYHQGRNPLYHPLTKSIPFHTIFVGDSTQDKDLSIQRVFHNDIIFQEINLL